MFDFLKKKKYNHFFVYKWGILAGIVEAFLILLSAFTMVSLTNIFSDNSEMFLVFSTFYSIIAVIFTCLVVFGMPLYLLFKKRMVSTALLVLLMTFATLMVLFTILFLIILL